MKIRKLIQILFFTLPVLEIFQERCTIIIDTTTRRRQDPSFRMRRRSDGI
ncbi:hypothetical protein GWK48_06835 [Metallosphaera tengchongensis]|uniref:Uncharacterized protein n=1 Tax=Metallosphaera tengchongensis TaxID=1532350 RepID=A0A6N0NTN0_9CREN|nr:hypothetical protein [Metallosphaera tengchongensis]QKR00126.1 hypothetical protein GWK48_06835 [Metallosphaera tengchongensis]